MANTINFSSGKWAWPNKTLQPTAATGIALPGLEVTEVAAAAELGRSAKEEIAVGLDNEQILRLIQSTPPRCLQRFKPELVPVPAKWRHDLITAWKLVCHCGAAVGTIIGHPLRKLNPGIADDSMFVSPFSFHCAGCGTTDAFLDTGADGTGAELAKLEGADIGCAAYRGEGPGQPYQCPECGESRGEVVVALYFNEDYMYSLEEDEVMFPWENLFSGVHVYHKCSSCRKQSMATDIDTKY
jgi:hypothetical protein